MTTPAIAPYVPTYATYTPYITSAEFLAAPTGVDVSQLIPSGSNITQEAALADLIGRASNQADLICQKVLAATLDVVSGEYRIFNDQTLRIPVEYSPLVSVNAVSLGYAANALAPMTDLSGVWVGRSVVRVPVPAMASTAFSFSSQNPRATGRRGWMYATVQYVNGWAHTTIGAAAQGASSVTPVSVLGFVPGLPFAIKDGASSEAAVVDASYVVGSSVVPLASPLQYGHGAGTTASALPPVIKDAVIDLCKWLVKQRGSKGLAMGTIKGQPLTTASAKTQESEPGGTGDYRSAVRTLTPFRRAR